MKTQAFRIEPGKDLRVELQRFVNDHQLGAAAVVCCVGSLSVAVLRMANGKTIHTFEGGFEIVSLVGTLEQGNCHLHLSISDENGKVIGGHVKKGCIVRTTAEVVIGVLEEVRFARAFDARTGFEELVVKRIKE